MVSLVVRIVIEWDLLQTRGGSRIAQQPNSQNQPVIEDGRGRFPEDLRVKDLKRAA
jgi:hypothetical protein